MSDLLGTCGSSYAEWEGILYPQKQSKLKQYTFIFPTTEIDSILYRLPEQGMVMGWAAEYMIHRDEHLAGYCDDRSLIAASFHEKKLRTSNGDPR